MAVQYSFCKNKNCIYYSDLQSICPLNLKAMQLIICKYKQQEVMGEKKFRNR